MLDLEERTYEADNDYDAYRDTSHDGPEDRAIDHGSASNKARRVCLEPASNLIVIGNLIQVNRSVDDPVQARYQHRNEGRQCAEKKCRCSRLGNNLRELADRWRVWQHWLARALAA